MMAGLVVMVLILAIYAHSSGGASTWCVCKGVSDAVLQKTLDYACGAGADCAPIRQNGPCFNPNTVRVHCTYAVNSYFQRKGQASGSCDFAGTATLSTSDPSSTGCVYPASASATPITTSTPTMPSNSVGGSPYVTTPTTGVLGGGIGTGLGPSGGGINIDASHGGLLLMKDTVTIFSNFLANLFSLGLVFLLG